MNNQLTTLIQEEFGICAVEIKILWGYDNCNYHVNTNSDSYIFKTYNNHPETLDLVKAENELLNYVTSQDTQFPRPVKYKDGSYVKILNIAKEDKICRMLTFLDGDFFGNIQPTNEILISIGETVAKLDLQLQSYNNYTIQARQWKWDIQYFHINKKHINDIPIAKDRTLIEYFFQQYDKNVSPQVPKLRKSIIHGDFNEWNVLINNNKVTGVIDFGDICYSPLINELAITISYACQYVDDPLCCATTIIGAYNNIIKLTEEEISLLYYLIPIRPCISVCNAAYERIASPDNTYTSISENGLWKVLNRWLKINPLEAQNVFRQTVGIQPIKKSSINDIIDKRNKYFSPILSLSYFKPIYMNGAAFQYMYDSYGNTFLDAYNNIPHVGHSHPKVVEAGQRQMAKLNTNTRYLYDTLPEYAEKLLSKFPKHLNKVYFVNSGSAASDLAIRIARARTRYKNILVMEHGYHGNTQSTTDISDYKFSNIKGQGQKHYILKTPVPDAYRVKYKNDDGTVGKLFAQDVIENLINNRNNIAAFICEPILGCAGQVPLANGYLKEVYPAIRNQGGVCISDEVQTGFGRLGNHFWGFEAQEVVPDIVIIGKPMGNGHPMGAVITTTEIAESFGKGVEFFSSFGGNPVSCAIGISVLNVLEDECLQDNARNVGEYYISCLNDLTSEFECIGDVRGSGLFIGIEFVKDKASQKPYTQIANHVKNQLRNNNILVSTDGPHDSVIKSKPPLCFTKENVEQVVENLRIILQNYYN